MKYQLELDLLISNNIEDFIESLLLNNTRTLMNDLKARILLCS